MRRTIAVMIALVFLTAACSKKAETPAQPQEKQPDATVDMNEYSFIVSGSMKAGGTLRLSNKGKEFHMIGLGKLKEGKTLADAQAALQSEDEKDDASTYDQVGMPGSFVGPGSSADISVPTFAAGTYAMVCFINVEAEQTPHFVKGMINQIVVAPEQGTAPTADVSYMASKGKAITGPATLKAGRHTLKIERDSGGSVLEPALFKLNTGATVEQFGQAAKLFDEGPLPAGAASKLPGQIIASLFDFEEATVVYITADFTAGTYVLASEDSDVENTPVVPVERIEITVT